MPKDTKKEVKKVFPLQTTAQSNAYKEQVKVLFLLRRDKEMFWWSAQKSPSKKSPSKKLSPPISTSTEKIITVSAKLINSMS